MALIPPENLDIVNSYMTQTSIMFITLARQGNIEYEEEQFDYITNNTLVFIQDFVDTNYRLLQILENIKIVESSKDGKLLLTLGLNGDIFLFRRYINRGIRGRENIQYIRDPTNIAHLPNTKFICISEDKIFFITGDNLFLRKFVINTATMQYTLNNQIRPLEIEGIEGNNLVSLQITDNNIIACYFIRRDFDDPIYDNYIIVYDLNFVEIYRDVRLLERYELKSVQSSNDCRIISTLYESYIMNRSLIKIYIRNNDTFFPFIVHTNNPIHVNRDLTTVCISRNGRILVSIINNNLHIWYLDEDTINNIIENQNNRTVLRTLNFRLQVIPLNMPFMNENRISSLKITDDMKIICGTYYGGHILIFEKNEENNYSLTQTTLVFNEEFNNSIITNIKYSSFNRNILGNITMNDYGVSKKTYKKRSKKTKRRSKLKSSRRNKKSKRKSKKLKSSRRRKKSSKRSRRI
jgi:hypothetical protein